MSSSCNGDKFYTNYLNVNCLFNVNVQSKCFMMVYYVVWSQCVWKAVSYTHLDVYKRQVIKIGFG